ncbi:hypothetical protein ACOME3_006942 [Neoechinorhynchus agilis]
MSTIFMLLVSVSIAYSLPKNGSLSASTTSSPVSDEKWPNSWYLHQSALNIERVWNEGYTGKGVVVGIIDFGVECDHPELKGSILATLPSSTVYSSHGNGCAGIIAAKPDNNICSVGIAYDSKIISLNVNERFRLLFDANDPLEGYYGLKSSDA